MGCDKIKDLNGLFKIVNNQSMNEKKINALWSHVHWLSVLAQQGSFTAAAARLGVSKAAVSQRIAELEAHLDIAKAAAEFATAGLGAAKQRIADIKEAQRQFYADIPTMFLDSRYS